MTGKSFKLYQWTILWKKLRLLESEVMIAAGFLTDKIVPLVYYYYLFPL